MQEVRGRSSSTVSHWHQLALKNPIGHCIQQLQESAATWRSALWLPDCCVNLYDGTLHALQTPWGTPSPEANAGIGRSRRGSRPTEGAASVRPSTETWHDAYRPPGSAALPHTAPPQAGAACGVARSKESTGHLIAASAARGSTTAARLPGLSAEARSEAGAAARAPAVPLTDAARKELVQTVPRGITSAALAPAARHPPSSQATAMPTAAARSRCRSKAGSQGGGQASSTVSRGMPRRAARRAASAVPSGAPCRAGVRAAASRHHAGAPIGAVRRMMRAGRARARHVVLLSAPTAATGPRAQPRSGRRGSLRVASGVAAAMMCAAGAAEAPARGSTVQPGRRMRGGTGLAQRARC